MVQCGSYVSMWKSWPCNFTVLENFTMLVRSSSVSRALSVPSPDSDQSITLASHGQPKRPQFA
ncbi:hypothetical protein IG631_16507 [Alternaria alternata]|nr:hypothetical protein IG631_16507 [Alternaria alternata]